MPAMKYLLMIIFFFPALLIAQDKKLDCRLLQKALDNEDFQSFFHFEANHGEALVIVDKGNHFCDCKLRMRYGRAISVSNVLPDTINTNRQPPAEWANKIVLLSVARQKRTKNSQGTNYLLHFWQPVSDADVKLEVTTDRNNKVIKGLVKSSGVF